MTTSLATLRLLQISDSAFPSGSFAFSGGLETLAGDGMVDRRGDARRLHPRPGDRPVGRHGPLVHPRRA